MIVCQSCGHQNPDGTRFCASCKRYLGWEDAAVPAEPPAAVTASTVADGGQGSVLETTRPPVADSVAVAVAPSRPAAGPPPAAGQMPRAAQAPMPPAPVQPAPEQHLPPPDEPRPPRRQVAQPVHCIACGADNEKDRRFCRSCGAELVQPTVRRLPWWRRLFRRSAGPAAGERPSRRRRDRARRGRRAIRAVFAGALVVAVAVLAFPARHLLTSSYTTVKARFTTVYDPVKPVSATGSSATKDHQPGRAIDGIKNTAWAEAAPGPGANQWIRIQLGRAVDLVRIGITPGASDNEKAFRDTSRPRDVRLEFSNGTEQRITLMDSPTFQVFALSAAGVKWVQVDVLSAYPGQDRRQDTSIAEVEFFTKR